MALFRTTLCIGWCHKTLNVSSLASNYLDLFIVSFDIVIEELHEMPLPDRANIDIVILMYYLWMKLEGLFV